VRITFNDDIRLYIFSINNIIGGYFFMQLLHLLEEYLLEMKITNKSERTIKSVKNNCTLFIGYVEKSLIFPPLKS